MNQARRRLDPASGQAEELPRMSLIEHLEELRKRIFWCLGFVGVALFPCWAYVQEIFDFMQRPILKALPPGKHLAYTGLIDPFMLYFKVAALAALFVSTPFVLYQLWSFVSPGLYRRERRFVMPFVTFGTAFFISGGAFGYYVVFPYAVKVLLGFGKGLDPVITIERYFSFLMAVILGLGLMFELPIIIFILCQIGIVTPRFLMRHFRWAVLVIFVIAAIVTPSPDAFNVCLFALPTLLLYLLGVGAAALSGWRRDKAAAKAAAS
jgi:sec-independent protein translocase protein TatC